MVKIIKFRIKNYKSIKDSGECYLSNGLTILAGKNESGKTSILEALEDFDTDNEIREEAIPIHFDQEKPEITLLLQVSKKEINEIAEELKIDLGNEINVIELKKRFEEGYKIINHEEIFSKVIKNNTYKQVLY